MSSSAPSKIIEDDAGNLPSLAHTGTVPNEEATTLASWKYLLMLLTLHVMRTVRYNSTIPRTSPLQAAVERVCLSEVSQHDLLTIIVPESTSSFEIASNRGYVARGGFTACVLMSMGYKDRCSQQDKKLQLHLLGVVVLYRLYGSHILQIQMF